jgi:hypothetical protein
MWWKKAFHKLEAFCFLFITEFISRFVKKKKKKYFAMIGFRRRAIIPSSWLFYSHFGWEFCVQRRKELDTELQRRASEVSGVLHILAYKLNSMEMI